MSTAVKFCGMTRAEDVQAAVELGASAVGFVLVPSSPRFITLGQAAIIRRPLPAGVRAVALLRNPTHDEVQRALDELQPDLLQFHGEETAEFCAGFGMPYWKAVPMAQPQDLHGWEQRFASAEALLLDAHAAGADGGTGRRFDWSGLPRLQRGFVLAGGLTPENVAEAIFTARPHTVDVSSGVEQRPGIKDRSRMARFMEAVGKADGR